ncbi:hypothetical protein T08_16523, partial [Trichinella sp. T8]
MSLRLLKDVKLRIREHSKQVTYHSTNILNDMIVSGTSENLTEEEKIMLMMKESTEAYDPK